nr:KOW domain-containing RNA-binding protein [Clostridium sp. DJ247]
MLHNNDCIGRVVYSKAGRDKGRVLMILSVLNDKYVNVCDGNLRTIEKPKKKKVKHLTFTMTVAEDVRDMLLSGEKINNVMISKFLQSYDNSKEV